MRWWRKQRTGEAFGDDRNAWRDLPELEGVPRTRALDVYLRARARARRRPATWALLAMLLSGYVALFTLFIYARPSQSSPGDWISWVRLVLSITAFNVLNWA